ncbi:carbohydrate ABC transporter permease [Candidatus Aerophobetes bacterium]|nr:carbohydrate ABC transporter permease [Candidatus Aerophobetes bacterium]
MAIIPQVGRKKIRVRLLLFSITLFLWLGVFLHLFPVWWTLVTSISPYHEVYKLPPSFFPRHPTLFPYKFLFSAAMQTGVTIRQGERIVTLHFGYSQFYPIWVYLKNSVILTGGIMVFQIPITALVAYSLSKLHSPRWNRILFIFFIGTMLIPYQISLVPSYLLLKNFPFAFRTSSLRGINFLDTYWAVILPGMYSAFNCLLFKGYFDGIPESIIQAARLDGASELGIIRRIILPTSKPVFAVVSYFTFTGAWNSFMWPLIVFKKAKLFPLPVFLYEIQASVSDIKNPEYARYLGGGIPLVMAAGIIQSIPVFIMFIIFREQLMKGIQLRGFK